MTPGPHLAQTPSQTVGPFFAFALTPEQYGYEFRSIATSVVASPAMDGQHIRLQGRVLDGRGEPITDAMIEIWQADDAGRYADPAKAGTSNIAFTGFGRCGTGTDPEHRFVFETIKPASVDGIQAPHISVAVFMRGLLVHAFTRIYFADDAAAHATDPVLQAVPEARRRTLIAERIAGPGPGAMQRLVYRFDIRMQGDDETVFFDA